MVKSSSSTTPRRRYYFLVLLLGVTLMVTSAVIDPNPLAFFAGMFVGGAIVAYDR